MKRIFLGRPIHWLFILLIVGGGLALGLERLHVIHFNTFVITLFAATVVLLGLVLSTAKGDDPLTRDPIPEPGEEQS